MPKEPIDRRADPADHASEPQRGPESSRRRILDAARDLFAAHGVAATTMAQVAERAGVSKGLAYHYFEGKEAILREIVESRWDEIHQAYLVIGEIEEPRQRLAAMIDEALERLGRDAARERLYSALFLDPAMQPVLAAAKANRVDAVADLYRTVRHLMDELQPARAMDYALLFTATLHGLTILSAVPLDGEPGGLREAFCQLFAPAGA